MGESTCLMHSVSFPSGIPSESNSHGSHVHALGDSVSFGRFASESLAWDKWSAFPHRRYVEEAKSYAQPGSVAQKKAFFEAHYKKVAPQKAAAAAAAAAAAEQEKAKSQIEERVCDSQATVFSEEQQIITQDAADYSSTVNLVEPLIEKTVVAADAKNKELLNNTRNLEDDVSPSVSVSEDSRTSQMGRPLLKSKLNTDQEVLQPKIRRKPAVPSFRSTSVGKKQSPAKYAASMHSRKENMVTPRTKNSNTIESIDQKKSAPRSLYTLMKSGSVKEPCKLNTQVVRKTERTKLGPSAHSTPKRSATPSKKLEEKFNEKEAQKVQLQTTLKEKAETEFRRLRQSFCFKARPLPSFYNEPKSPIKKTPQAKLRSLTPAQKLPTTISQPSSISSVKKSSRRLWKTNDQNPNNHPLASLARRINHENISPNIQN
ncbi:uncharacterized protein LOC143612544 [Bidens hawaiensis]|uniref:uncharacterized protein LOC143612544 n=1 Tax=Bidens hawaiensis TaxID=980011 RepID=UPI00404B7CDD